MKNNLRIIALSFLFSSFTIVSVNTDVVAAPIFKSVAVKQVGESKPLELSKITCEASKCKIKKFICGAGSAATVLAHSHPVITIATATCALLIVASRTSTLVRSMLAGAFGIEEVRNEDNIF